MRKKEKENERERDKVRYHCKTSRYGLSRVSAGFFNGAICHGCKGRKIVLKKRQKRITTNEQDVHTLRETMRERERGREERGIR